MRSGLALATTLFTTPTTSSSQGVSTVPAREVVTDHRSAENREVSTRSEGRLHRAEAATTLIVALPVVFSV